jgi:hypothetical protein
LRAARTGIHSPGRTQDKEHPRRPSSQGHQCDRRPDTDRTSRRSAIRSEAVGYRDSGRYWERDARKYLVKNCNSSHHGRSPLTELAPLVGPEAANSRIGAFYLQLATAIGTGRSRSRRSSAHRRSPCARLRRAWPRGSACGGSLAFLRSAVGAHDGKASRAGRVGCRPFRL